MNDNLKWQLLALFVVLGLLLYWLAPVLTPFAVAALFAYLGDPWVDRLQRLRLGRTAAVTVVFSAMSLAMALVVIGLIPTIERQFVKLLEKIPAIMDWFALVLVPWVEQRTGLSLQSLNREQLLEAFRTHWQQAGGFATAVLASLSTSGMAVAGFVGSLMLIPVVTFYLLRDWDDMVAHAQRLLPRSIEPIVSRLARESDAVLGAFLRGQLLVMLALCLIYSLGLLFVGLDLAILIGLVAGIISFVPYLGLIIGGGFALIAAAVQFQDWLHPLLAVGVFVVGQVLEGFYLTPKLVGGRVGLHPVVVIFAILAGGQLFGFLGVLLALPIASLLMVVLRYLHGRYLDSALYATESKPQEVIVVATSMHETCVPPAGGSEHAAKDKPI